MAVCHTVHLRRKKTAISINTAAAYAPPPRLSPGTMRDCMRTLHAHAQALFENKGLEASEMRMAATSLLLEFTPMRHAQSVTSHQVSLATRSA